jgi:acyl-CoA thioester hydrolase
MSVSAASEKIQFRFHTDVETRFRDIDAFQHVNQAVYLTILEEARLRYFENVLQVTIPEAMKDWVLADIHCKYLAPIRYGDRLEVAIKVQWIRRSSFGAAYEIKSRKTGSPVVAMGEFVQVHVSPSGKSSPIPPSERLAMEKFDAVQGEAPE